MASTPSAPRSTSPPWWVREHSPRPPGEPARFYREWDATAARSGVYARSKEAAEKVVISLLAGRFYIVRTAWLYNQGGNNFNAKIIAAAEKHGSLRVVAVQTVGMAVIAALIGAGGLGALVFQGLLSSALDLVLLGVVPTIALAVVVDALFALWLALLRGRDND